MRPGPAPKPTMLKILDGNPGKRPLPENEPKPPAAIPTPPRCLDRAARAEWRRVVKQLFDIGLMSHLDRTALAVYCVEYSRWTRAELEIKKSGEVVTTLSGHPIPNPWLSVARQAQNQMHRHGVEFGMSPASRSRLSVPKPVADDDGMEALLSRKEKRAKI